jgi:hypothetical protein
MAKKTTSATKTTAKKAPAKKTTTATKTTVKKPVTSTKKATTAKKTSAPKKVAEPKKEMVECIFLNKKSKKLLERGKFPANVVANNPTLYFKEIIDAQSNAKHYLDEIKHELKEEEYAEIKFTIEQFS